MGRTRAGAVTVSHQEPPKEDHLRAAPEVATEGETLPQAEIARRAYELYVERGGEDGHDVEDWLRAEAELLHDRGGAAS